MVSTQPHNISEQKLEKFGVWKRIEAAYSIEHYNQVE